MGATCTPYEKRCATERTETTPVEPFEGVPNTQVSEAWGGHQALLHHIRKEWDRLIFVAQRKWRIDRKAGEVLQACEGVFKMCRAIAVLHPPPILEPVSVQRKAQRLHIKVVNPSRSHRQFPYQVFTLYALCCYAGHGYYRLLFVFRFTQLHVTRVHIYAAAHT